jgi:hypothetical protein
VHFIFCDLITHGRRLSSISAFVKGTLLLQGLYLSIYLFIPRRAARSQRAGRQAGKPTHLFSKRKAMFAITR